MKARILAAILAASVVSVAHEPAAAQSTQQAQLQAEIQAAWKAGVEAATAGPAEIKLLDQASLKIAADELFIPAAQANRIMVALGNSSSPERRGLIISKDERAPWMVDVSWTKEGYVRDGDAKEWQADALLESLKEGTEQSNAERIARGFPALDVIGWVEPPNYDATAHRLVWSLSSRDRSSKANQPQGINYNTYALGRDGYFSLDLITGSDTISKDKQVARDLLGSLNFVQGKRYQDFNGSTDKVAAYGLAALVGAVAVKKLGLLAVIGVFLLKVWKLGLIALAAIGAAVKRFLGRREADAES
ncbi:MAG: DUF2167 domain-containing protein [Sphingobium sp.]|nr:DUF2167 domain-containing protein [Sphingobium sp.]